MKLMMKTKTKMKMKMKLKTAMRPLLLVGFLLSANAIACSKSGEDPYAAETAQREAFAKARLEEVDAGRAWGVSSTSEIQFDEGFGMLSYDPPDQTKSPSFYNHAFRWMGQNAHIRLKAHGTHPMKVVVAGWLHENVTRTRPVINVFVDGYYAGSSGLVEKAGHYWIDLTIPSWMFRRPWVDLTLRTNAVGFHWGDPPQLNVALVYKFSWTEAP
jgi:hypothetical protein